MKIFFNFKHAQGYFSWMQLPMQAPNNLIRCDFKVIIVLMNGCQNLLDWNGIIVLINMENLIPGIRRWDYSKCTHQEFMIWRRFLNLCRESNGHGGAATFSWLPEQPIVQTVELPVMWDLCDIIWTSDGICHLDPWGHIVFNSLAPGRFEYSLKLVNFKLISTINVLSIFREISIRWMPQHLTYH